MTKKIIYEQHPLSEQRKRELMESGYKIIDARFAPDDYVHPDAKQQRKQKPPLTAAV